MMQITTINGVKHRYNVSGHGDSIVLLHGWGSNLESFAPVHVDLARHARVYSIDLPGFGGSEEPPTPWGVVDYANALREFIERHIREDVAVVAHSFGGRVAIALAASGYHKLRKLVLVDSAGIRPQRTCLRWLRALPFKVAKFILTLPLLSLYTEDILERARRRFGSSDYRNASPMMRRILVKCIAEDLTPVLRTITCPTLLVWGDQDRETPFSDAKLMERLIPDAGLVTLQGCGHWAYLERLPQFLTIITHFLIDGKADR